MPIILKRGTEANRAGLSLKTGEPIFTTDTCRLYIGSGSAPTGKEIEFGQLSASFVSASVISATTMSCDVFITENFSASFTSMSVEELTVLKPINATCSFSHTSSYLLGSISSASFAQTSATSSYLSSSGQNVALGDILSTDTSSGVWAGNQSVTGSGIFVQRSALAARSTLLSAGTTVNGNGSYNIAVAAGTLGAISPTLNGHFGTWQLQTYGGSTWSTSARMMIQTSGDHNEGSRPTDIIFQSTPSGSTTLQTRLKVNGSGVQVTGSLGVNGPITSSAINVQTLVVTTISSSVEYVSGSTIHGSLMTNTHQFTGSVLVSGSLTVNNRILGDFNNATTSVRTLFQTTTTNGNSVVGVIPNGTATLGAFNAYGSSNSDTSSLIQIGCNQSTGLATVGSAHSGTGTTLPLAFTIDGSEKMRVDTAGSVGIGTTAPETKLHVAATGGTIGTCLARFDGGDTWHNAIQIANSSSREWALMVNGSSRSPAGALSLFDKTAGADRLIVTAGGEVGIGTTSPNERFTVGGSGTFGMGFQHDSTTIAAIKPNTITGEVQHFATTNYFPTFYSNNVERIRIAANGNVGIGTTSPTSKLTVFGSDQLVFASSSNANAYYRSTGTTNDAAFGVDSTGGFFSVVNSAPLSFKTTNVERMRIAANGNVGINTASPSGILDVAKPSSGGRFQVVNEGADVYNVIASRNAADSAYLPMTIRSGPVVFAPGTGSITIDATSNLKYTNATIESYFGGDGTAALVGTTSNHGLSLYTANVARIMVSTSGGVRFNNYGAGTLVTDSSGNITATSDGRMKDVSGSFDRGLDAIINLSPKVYHWKEESGLNADDVNVGLIAQEVLPYIPEAIGYKDDKYTMSDRPIISALINAVKELKADNDQLRARIEALES